MNHEDRTDPQAMANLELDKKIHDTEIAMRQNNIREWLRVPGHKLQDGSTFLTVKATPYFTDRRGA